MLEIYILCNTSFLSIGNNNTAPQTKLLHKISAPILI